MNVFYWMHYFNGFTFILKVNEYISLGIFHFIYLSVKWNNFDSNITVHHITTTLYCIALVQFTITLVVPHPHPVSLKQQQNISTLQHLLCYIHMHISLAHHTMVHRWGSTRQHPKRLYSTGHIWDGIVLNQSMKHTETSTCCC